MQIINILTLQQKHKRGFNEFHPIFKWEKEFKKEDIKFNFFKSHLNKKIYEADVLMIDSRYYEMILKGHHQLPSKGVVNDVSFIIEFIINARKNVHQIVLFDTSDGGSGFTFNITPYVDVHLKKQMYIDKTRYHQFQEYNYMPWLPKGEAIKEKKNKKMLFTPLKPEDTRKLKLAWNIGMCDYREFPLKKYYPIGTQNLLNGLYKNLNFRSPSNDREYLLSYRGSSNRFPSYDYQRNLVLNQLKNLDIDNAIVGDKIPYEEYIKEQLNSKISISPFGWGEICYRDFESVINGCVLLKPDMSHLDTFPNYFTKDTYVPFSWDCSDLVSTIEKVKNNFEDYMDTIYNAQELFKQSQLDSETFIKHFKKNVLD